MNVFRSPRKAAVLILLALGLGVGGWGILSKVGDDPGGGAGWFEKWFGDSGAADNPQVGGLSQSGDGGGGRSGAGDLPNGRDGASGVDGDGALRKTFDPHALPIGLTSIDGEAGTGINRVVRKNGVWFPVYSPGPESTSGVPPLTVIPLSIASGTPPPGKVNEPYRYQAEAIGGTPPYRWSVTTDLGAAGFSLSPTEGTLTGFSAEPVTLRLQLKVTDAAKATDSAELKLVIRPDRALAIDSASLPAFGLDQPVDFQFDASGGVPPYQWSVAPRLPAGLTLHTTGTRAGVLEGPVPTEALEMPVTITVTDSQDEKVQKPFVLKIAAGLDIATPSALPPAVPGQAYRGSFQAEGGTPPYQWEKVSGEFPDAGWKLSPEGVLTNSSSQEGSVGRFVLRVTDMEGETFEKSFTLVVSDLLILVPSREKVGVAWHPAATAQVAAAAGVAVVGYRVSRDGVPVYEGTGSNFVDHGVPTGSTPRYTLEALGADGGAQPLTEKQTAVLPQVLTRAKTGNSGDPFADRVVRFSPLAANGYGSSALPNNVTGPPDGRDTFAPASKPGEVLSLHARVGAGGFVELEFTDNIVEMGPGEDLTVFENVLFIGRSANQRFMEPAVISVALFPGEWHALPCDVVPPAGDQPLDLRDPFYYARGIAGRNATSGEDPTDPSRSGGDSLDLEPATAAAGLSWIRYIRIQSTGDQARRDDVGGDVIRHTADPAFSPLTGAGNSGFDLDAVSAVHY